MAFTVSFLCVCVVCLLCTIIIMWTQNNALKRSNRFLGDMLKQGNRNNIALCIKVDCEREEKRKLEEKVSKQATRINELEKALRDTKSESIKAKCREVRTNDRKKRATDGNADADSH